MAQLKHVNLPQTNISNEISFILHKDESAISNNSHSRIKHQILEHIYSGIDVILITSSKSEVKSIFLQHCFDDTNDQIRTISLNSNSFANDDLDANSSEHDLSMISAVIYESIHLDTHFAIIIDDADQLPIQILNELIKLALAINTSKNNVNFVFAGGPDLLGIVQQISEITRMGLAHCSLDEITEEDIKVYIDEKQSVCIESKKLKFNKYALKKISSHANGSLHKASTLLEWCREYAVHTGNFKITVGFIDQVLSDPECNHLLSSYPSPDFTFSSAIKSNNNDESIEFSHQNVIEPSQDHSEEASRTVYIDETIKDINNDEDSIEQENVYEKVMATKTGEVVSIDDSEIMNVTLSDNDTHNLSINTQDTTSDTDYLDTYQIEALKDINNPLSPTYADELSTPTAPAQLASASKTQNNSAFIWIFFILSILIGSYYLFTSNIISSDGVRKYINNIISSSSNNESDNPSNVSTQSIAQPAPSIVDTDDVTKQNIIALLELAKTQIEQKKLSTPPSDNALDTYRLILDSDPNNKLALAGINLIKDRYQTWANLDIKDGNSKRAIYFLQRSIDISPDEETIKLLSNLQ